MSPIESHREARYRNAIRGLTFPTGFVESSADAAHVLAERHAGEGVEVLLQRGAEELERNMLDEVLATYTLAVLLDASDATAYEGLGRAFLAKRKKDNAIASFRTALRLDPTLSEARFLLGAAYWTQGDYQEALASWRRILDFDPNHAKAHERLAIALYFLRDYAESWQHVHAAEALGHQVPPQFRPLLEAQMPEPR
jgi:tetratricopeptide (TPR) repeat protein